MQIHRLDPSQTPMAAAVQWFMVRACDGQLDLSHTLVATPGARAGRVLVTLLAQACQGEGLALAPPRTVTAGRLAEALAPAARPAGELHRSLAWRAVLADASPDELAAVLPHASDPEQWADELGLAADELARGGLRCADVARAELPPLEDPGRWHAMALLQERYEALLGRAGLADPSMHAIDAGPAVAHGLEVVVLLGCPDLTNQARKLVARVPCETHALVSLEAGLCPDGVVDEAYWRDAEIEVDPSTIFITGGPEEQGTLAVRAAVEMSTSTVGTADESLAGAVRRSAAGHGLSVHVAWGSSASAAGPGRLLSDLALLLHNGGFASMSRVLRCPVVVAALASADRGFFKLPRALDTYENSALPTSAFGALPVGDESAGNARHLVFRARKAFKHTIEPLRGKPRPLREWAEPIERVLVGLLEPVQDSLGRESVAALEAIGQQLRTLVSIPELLGDQAVPAHEAISLVLGQLAGPGTPGEPGGEDLDVLGWLELPLDPSPALVVMGTHHSTLPGASTPGPLLTEGLRRALGLPGEARRLARDAAVMATLIGGQRQVRFVLGTVDTAGEPLLPSTLLLRGSGDGPARVLERVRQAFETSAATEAPERCGYRVGVMRDATPITSMSVTSFRTFLESPYLFYLRHALKLHEVQPASRIARLEANTFGTLLHEALHRFAAVPETRDITNEAKIRQLMHAALWEATEQLAGGSITATMLAQIDAAERRLSALAALESHRRLAGWRTIEVEWTPPARPMLGQTGVLLRGTIDRIDWHEGEQRLALLDYKTSDHSKEPGTTHRHRDGTWRDLQLPLYEMLARPIAADRALETVPTLGYISLSSSDARVLEAPWDYDDLAIAHECAIDIAHRVTRGLEAMADLGNPAHEGPLTRLAGVGMLLDPEHTERAVGGGS